MKICPKMSFFNCFCFWKIFFFLQGEWSFPKNKRKNKNIFWVENLSNFVAQHNWTDFQRNLGQIFNSTILLIFGLFSFLKKCRNHYFIVFSAKNWKFISPPQKLKNTICEHNCANWFFFVRFFSAFLLFWVFAVSGFLGGGLFWEEWKKQKKDKFKTKQQKTKRKKDHKMQTRKTT